jgi:hypothetical protein
MFVDTKETSFLQDLTKPSLEALSHILRHKELWPTGFEWNYGFCYSCAMGLAGELWDVFVPRNPDAAVLNVSKAFGISRKVAGNIFGGEADWIPYHPGCVVVRDTNAVTPEMVADQIDKFLAVGRTRSGKAIENTARMQPAGEMEDP